MDDYREQYRKACEKAFEGFQIDLGRCREPDVVLKVLDMAKSGMFSKEIAQDVGKSQKAIQKIYRRYNFPSLHNILPPKREQRHDWKGGVKMMKGYRYLRTPGHPSGTKHGCYVAEHRLVMENKIGRYLLPTEVVDHIDGDISNNHPSNLRVFENNAEHLRVTLKGKCPNWSEEGKAALRGPKRQKHH
jgi:hypothetical protein